MHLLMITHETSDRTRWSKYIVTSWLASCPLAWAAQDRVGERRAIAQPGPGRSFVGTEPPTTHSCEVSDTLTSVSPLFIISIDRSCKPIRTVTRGPASHGSRWAGSHSMTQVPISRLPVFTRISLSPGWIELMGQDRCVFSRMQVPWPRSVANLFLHAAIV
jgi:hypothetical protein